MGKLTIIFWRDIPAQVIGQQGRTRCKKVLDERFAAAIDRAAMRAGKGSSHAYLEEWRRENRTFGGELEQAVNEAVSTLEAQFSPELLNAMIKTGGTRIASQEGTLKQE
jgi:hypothetical protein